MVRDQRHRPASPDQGSGWSKFSHKVNSYGIRLYKLAARRINKGDFCRTCKIKPTFVTLERVEKGIGRSDYRQRESFYLIRVSGQSCHLLVQNVVIKREFCHQRLAVLLAR